MLNLSIMKYNKVASFVQINVKENILLIEGTTMNSTMRKYLNKILGNCCKECSQGREWNGKQLVLQIDHMNGNKKDNRIINLRLLCPNCHSQTGNWGIKNISDKGKNNLSTNKKADAR